MILRLFWPNIMLYIIGIILILSMAEGYKKGFLRIAFSLASWLIAIVLVITINPYVTGALERYTGIDETIEARVEDYLREKEKKALYGDEEAEDETEEDVKEDKLAEKKKEKGISEEDYESLISEDVLELPAVVVDFLRDGVVKSVDDMVEESGIYTSVATGIAHFILQGIAFLITWIIVWAILGIAEESLKIVSHIPVLGRVNKTLGLFMGALKVLLLVWLFFYIISLCCTTEFGKLCIAQIKASAVLTWLYENNLLLELVISLAA